MKKFKTDEVQIIDRIVLLWILIVAFPLVGVYKIITGNENEKATGIVLLIIGLVIWMVVPN